SAPSTLVVTSLSHSLASIHPHSFPTRRSSDLPYSDIPSLYDMYVQASVHQRPNERFGMEVFRNTANDPQAIPMDLPVGPDYVIGDRKSTRLNSSHVKISYAVFCLKKKKNRLPL